MSKIAQKVLRFGRRERWSVILEFAIGPVSWVIWPGLIYFPPDAPDRLGGSPTCHDLTLAWLRFGVTLRFEP